MRSVGDLHEAIYQKPVRGSSGAAAASERSGIQRSSLRVTDTRFLKPDTNWLVEGERVCQIK